MIKSILKQIFPKSVRLFFLYLRHCPKIMSFYFYDMLRFIKFSGLFYPRTSEVKFVSDLVTTCHIVEKGLTMSNMRLGFGVEKLSFLVDLCTEYLSRGYDRTDCQFMHTIGVMEEYKRVHENKGYIIDLFLFNKMNSLIKDFKNIPFVNQIECTNESYFDKLDCSFDVFSTSRHSVRDFSNEKINVEILRKAVLLAQNAPSSCNRQQARVYIVSDKDKIKQILDSQNGHRGFGHLADKLIILTSSVEEYNGIGERNSVYIDGGLFGMNLLYTLHYYKIGVCTLNAYFSAESEKRMRSLCGVPESEVFLMIMACGKVPAKFKVACSQRNNLTKILRII